MEQTLRDHLSTLASKYAALTGTTAATVGKRAINDNTFFARVLEGQGFTVRTFDKVVAWFSDNWPDDASWPEGIERRPFRGDPEIQSAEAPSPLPSEAQVSGERR
jgi:hypothetical protein